MKERKQVNPYRAPECQMVPAETSYLMQTSFPNSGGHNKVGDDGNNLNAKQGWFDEEEEETSAEEKSYQLWEE